MKSSENLGARREFAIRKDFDKSCQYNRPVQYGRDMGRHDFHLNESSSARLGGSQQLEILPSPNSKQAHNLSA